jgi:hypothetical protein
MNAYRHGDLCLVVKEELPSGLTPLDSKVLMTGSGGNDHTFDQGTFYPNPQEDQFIIGFLEAREGTQLFHKDHGEVVKGETLRIAKLPAGIYELRKQQEFTHEGMRPVID